MYNYNQVKPRFNVDKNTVQIPIIIKNVYDIYKRFSYVGLKECSINRELEEYIIETMNRLPQNKKVMLIFYILEYKSQLNVEILKESIHNYFKGKAIDARLFLRKQLIQWCINMFIGILFLILCIIIVEILDKFSYIHILMIAKESLMIIGWVALWEPLNFILFGWKAIKKDIMNYNKLSKAAIKVESINQ